MSNPSERRAFSPPVSNFAGSLIDTMDRLVYRRVQTGRSEDPIYRLRYNAYRREGDIPSSADQSLLDQYDQLPNAYNFSAEIDGELVSSIRVHLMKRDFSRSPSFSVFADVLGPLLLDGPLVDSSRFTADHSASLAYPALPFFTLRLVLMAVEHFDCAHMISTVRPEHSAFYRRVFRASEIGEERYFEGLSFPVIPMSTPRSVMPEIYKRYPFFLSTPRERDRLFEDQSFPRVVPTARTAMQQITS